MNPDKSQVNISYFKKEVKGKNTMNRVFCGAPMDLSIGGFKGKERSLLKNG